MRSINFKVKNPKFPLQDDVYVLDGTHLIHDMYTKDGKPFKRCVFSLSEILDVKMNFPREEGEKFTWIVASHSNELYFEAECVARGMSTAMNYITALFLFNFEREAAAGKVVPGDLDFKGNNRLTVTGLHKITER